MVDGRIENTIQLKVHFSSPPEKVFGFLATGTGREAFWADSAVEQDGVIHFRFSNGMTHEGKVLAIVENELFAVEYFGGSKAMFELSSDDLGGTDLTLIEVGIPDAWFDKHKAEWVSVLLVCVEGPILLEF